MSTKYAVILFLIATSTFTGLAQENISNNSSYKVSNPYKVFDFDYNFYVSKGNEIVVIKFIRSHCVIQRFNTAIPELVKENRYSDFFPNGFKIETLKEIAGKYYFFYSIKSKKEENVFAQEINFDDVEFINQPKLVLKSEGKLENSKQSEYLFKNRTTLASGFEFIQSKEKSNLLIKYIKKNESSINISLFDKNLMNIYSKALPFEKDANDKIIFSSIVDSIGNLYFVSKEVLKSEEKKEVVYKICFNTIKFNSNDIIVKELNFENQYCNEIRISIFNNEIICGGFTSDIDTSKNSLLKLGKSTFNNSNQIVAFKLNLDGELLEKYNFNFPENIIKFYKNRQDENYINNLYLHDFEIMKNGDIIVIGEQFGIEGYYQQPDGVYRDILICNFNIKGKLNFIKRMPKLQVAANESQPFSFKTFFTDDAIFIPFIDNIDNLDNSKITKIKNCNGDLILSRISLTDGNISRKFILNISQNEKNLNKFSVNRFYKSNLNSFCFDAYKKDKEDIIISVDFQ